MSDAVRPKWALILGASSGFGGATARALAADGFNIFGVHLDRRSTMPVVEEVKSDCEKLGADVMFFNINAADEAKRDAALDQMRSRLDEDGGTIVCLFHSLAFGTLVRFVPMPDVEEPTVSAKQMTMTQEVMANSLVYWTQGMMARSMMESGGRIFAMTSTGGSQVSPSYGVVSAAKAALEAHCRQLAYELLPYGITANSICAGVTDTPALKKIPGAEKLKSKSLDKSPIGRLTYPDDVGGAVAALCDPRLHWMTANVLGIHGGEPFIG